MRCPTTSQTRPIVRESTAASRRAPWAGTVSTPPSPLGTTAPADQFSSRPTRSNRRVGTDPPLHAALVAALFVPASRTPRAPRISAPFRAQCLGRSRATATHPLRSPGTRALPALPTPCLRSPYITYITQHRNVPLRNRGAARPDRLRSPHTTHHRRCLQPLNHTRSTLDRPTRRRAQSAHRNGLEQLWVV
jgi:hypothetical protein